MQQRQVKPHEKLDEKRKLGEKRIPLKAPAQILKIDESENVSDRQHRFLVTAYAL
jgi:hypothetical protein